MNQLTCITIDVSQGKSHIQGFVAQTKPLGKAKRMRHSKQGYQLILNLKELIEAKTNTIPLVVSKLVSITSL